MGVEICFRFHSETNKNMWHILIQDVGQIIIFFTLLNGFKGWCKLIFTELVYFSLSEKFTITMISIRVSGL